ncbi:uncharacterized protein BDR25DRAFT_357102 [Lindgomyces ingoldianus]|uniref:Uncharacterized protein n=1 Tax=Lindgomyces ingoldianus TaxID=673940 RepID=A0ACB6QP10_9PLEO|nr:uncharacterized protein BDR25DRAFT_357102 [Lindgomyces ingoldianus]KAF2468733.1 hypothetical protein BDR25DRAFT_357102 [Lindgomyces ingoldianus]
MLALLKLATPIQCDRLSPFQLTNGTRIFGQATGIWFRFEGSPIALMEVATNDSSSKYSRQSAIPLGFLSLLGSYKKHFIIVCKWRRRGEALQVRASAETVTNILKSIELCAFYMRLRASNRAYYGPYKVNRNGHVLSTTVPSYNTYPYLSSSLLYERTQNYLIILEKERKEVDLEILVFYHLGRHRAFAQLRGDARSMYTALKVRAYTVVWIGDCDEKIELRTLHKSKGSNWRGGRFESQGLKRVYPNFYIHPEDPIGQVKGFSAQSLQCPGYSWSDLTTPVACGFGSRVSECGV